MSEYWKSTPKYWCKHCKTYVRDSKLEKQNHEATPKHQGNLQRFLRELHRGNERESREKERAKDEVARLKGTARDATNSPGIATRQTASSASGSNKQATTMDRKRQLQQLAEMGVAVPEESRREMAMAGDWQIRSVRPIFEKSEVMKEEEDDENYVSGLAVGVRKRKFDGDDEKEEAGETVIKRGWGSTTMTWKSDDNGDLDALLMATNPLKKSLDATSGPLLPGGSIVDEQPNGESSTSDNKISSNESIKREYLDIGPLLAETIASPGLPSDVAVKNEDVAGEVGLLFKKRKSKTVRQKD